MKSECLPRNPAKETTLFPGFLSLNFGVPPEYKKLPAEMPKSTAPNHGKTGAKARLGGEEEKRAQTSG